MGETDQREGSLPDEKHHSNLLHNGGLPLHYEPSMKGSSTSSRVLAPLDNIGMIELLEHDNKLTFIVDLNHIRQTTPDILRVVYSNSALRSHPDVGNLILGMGTVEMMSVAYGGFKTWIENNLEHDDPSLTSSTSFGGILWTGFTLRDRFRVVSGMIDIQAADISFPSSQHKAGDRNHVEPRPAITSKQSGDSDLGVESTPAPGHIKFFNDFDWSSTALGSIETWTPLLKQTCKLLMSDPNPVFLFWGEEMNLLYNEAAMVVVAERHPHAMGRPGKESFGEVWDDFSAQFASVRISGKPLRMEMAPAHMQRHGRLDECYVTYTYLPITEENGVVVGIYETFQDITRQVLSERRLSTLLEISTCSANIKETGLFWKRLLQALEQNPYDVPFFILYSVEEMWLEHPKTSNAAHRKSIRQCILQGSLGVPDAHVSTPAILDLDKGMEGYSSAFRKATEAGDPVVLRVEDGTLPEDYVTGFGSRGFGDPCTAAVVCTIRPTQEKNVVGFLVLGLNPRQGYDGDQQQFVDILSRQIATSVASVALLDEEIRRGRTYAQQAAIEQAELTQKLDRRTQELMNSETKFEHMADLSPVGLMTADPSGNVAYANKAWYHITGHPGNVGTKESWLPIFEDEDVPFIEAQFMKLITTQEPLTFECRMRKKWTKELPNGEIVKTSTWVLISAYVEVFDDGTVRGARSTVTDISEQKWSEEIQKRRMEEAIERKRQQEAFIDMTSHEMRNPLSAILQCADSITTSLRSTLDKLTTIPKMMEELLDSNIDAAETITLCAQHQKRIVDDVLTLSKLDSEMLMVTPVNVQLLQVAQHVMKMFEGEAKKHNTTMGLHLDDSYKEARVDWVQLDPSRLTQVLVNILGNALKFTQTSPERRISVRLSASVQEPSEHDQHVEYIPVQNGVNKKAEYRSSSEKDKGDALYLQFSVQDTGLGLSTTEKQMLFKRFGQASPRTHVEYGGSGLGLFISRKLTELQGGAIGFSSQLGKGSTFAFYIKARRSTVSTPSSPVSPKPMSNGTHAEAVLSKLNVLVVEDNLVNQKVLCKQLQNHGHAVYAANHGGEALVFLNDTKFWKGKVQSGKELSIILMDTEMPVMDGLTCVRKIRKLQRDGTIIRHIPIISVTANARSGQIETAKMAGVDDVVSKPFLVTELLPRMQALVQRHTP